MAAGQAGSMQYRSSQIAVALSVVFITLPLLSFPQEPPPREKQAPKDQTPKPRLDLYGDPLPEGAVVRCGTGRFRHGLPVQCVAFSPDGRTLVSAGSRYGEPHWSTGTPFGIRIWDPNTGELLRELMHEKTEGGTRTPGQSQITANRIAFSPDGKYLASQGGNCATVEIWNLAGGEIVRRLEGGPGNPAPISYSPDGMRLACAGDGNSVMIWDPRSGERLKGVRAPGRGKVACFAYSPDGRVIALTSDGDPGVYLWNASSSEGLQRLVAGESAVTAVSFSGVGGRLAAGYADGTVLVWDDASGQVLHTLRGHESKVGAVDFTSDGKMLASGDDGGSIFLWSMSTGARVRTFCKTHAAIWTMDFSPDGKRLATGGPDCTIRVLDVTEGAETPPAKDHVGTVSAVAFSPDGALLATGSHDGTVRIWRARTGECVHTIDAHPPGVSSIAFSRDGETLLSGGRDGPIRIWDPEDGTRLGSLEGHTRTITDLDLIPGGKTMVSSGMDCSIRLWDTVGGKQIGEFKAWTVFQGRRGLMPTTALAASPDGKLLASASSGGQPVRLWDVVTGDLIRELRGRRDTVRALTFFPNGKWILCGVQNGTVVILDMDGKELLPLHPGTGVLSIALSPDGRLLAASGVISRSVFLMEMASGRKALELEGHGSGVRAVCFSSDGTYLASGSADTTAIIWDIYSPPGVKREAPEAIDPLTCERLLEDLTGEDAQRAFEAIRRLVGAGDGVVALLKARLSSHSEVDEDRLRELIADLDSPDYSRRASATRDLEEMGHAAEEALRKALVERPSPETEVRLKGLLRPLEVPFFLPSGDVLRAVRVVQVLERIGSAKSVDVLRTIANRSLHSVVRDDAKAALERLEARGTK